MAHSQVNANDKQSMLEKEEFTILNLKTVEIKLKCFGTEK